LTRAGLLRSERNGRSIIYSVNPQGIKSLLAYLVEDCCNGQPELCTPMASEPKQQERSKRIAD